MIRINLGWKDTGIYFTGRANRIYCQIEYGGMGKVGFKIYTFGLRIWWIMVPFTEKRKSYLGKKTKGYLLSMLG